MYSPKGFLFQKVEDKGLEQSASDCSDTAIGVQSVPLVSHFGGNVVRWNELRALIASCSDLPEACRQRLVAEGDAAVND